ncbi:MAG: class I SAM-dependent methyltransferase [Chitinophagaceae bacterium]
MNTREAYNQWALQYDSNENKTRDLEAIALRETLSNLPFDSYLEIGCGTGKNTEWLVQKAKKVTAIDLSTEMLAKAKQKIHSDRVEFKQADITTEWEFTDQLYDLVGFSLVLEHIEELGPVFKKTVAVLNPGGYVYIGELHPFKQYAGSKARFETAEGEQVVPCFNHHVTDFINAAKQAGLSLVDIKEYFDDPDRNTLPRILVLLFRKL